MAKIKIILADHHTLVREGLRSLLKEEPDIEIAAEAGDGFGTLEMVRVKNADVLLLDPKMPDPTGTEIIGKIKEISAKTAIVILTMFQGRGFIREALDAGATGFLLKTSPFSEIVSAIRFAVNSNYYLSSEINADIIENYLKKGNAEPPANRYDLLTGREQQLLRLIAEGCTTSEIASMLTISPKTVAKHRTNLMEKLEMKNTATLVRYALKIGVV